MLRLGLQFFAHKKGVGSTKNGRDSESKRLGVKKSDGEAVLAGAGADASRRALCRAAAASALSQRR